MRYKIVVALVRLGECEKAVELLEAYFATALLQSLVLAKHDNGLDSLKELPRFRETTAEGDAKPDSGAPKREITSPGRLQPDRFHEPCFDHGHEANLAAHNEPR